MIQEKLKKLIHDAIENTGIEPAKIELEHPTLLSHGDFSTNVAFIHATPTKTKPRDIADKILKYINENKPDFIEKVEIAGSGFINFFMSGKFFHDTVSEILKQKEKFGQNKTGHGKTVIVEYSSPNIAKPFTVGHLRSTIIGDAVSNLLHFSGYNVIRDNHIGDWGTQFGKLIVAIKKWSSEETLDKSGAPIKLLVDLYVKFHKKALVQPKLEDEARAWFARLERKDEEACRLWKKCVDLSMLEFGRIYERLGIEFDTIIPESFFEDKMGDVLEDLKKKNLVKESEGALLVFFPEEIHLPPLMIVKSDGATLYATRELATDKYRKEKYKPDLIINEVGSEQSLYFKQIFELEEMLSYFKKSKRVHVAHGLYRFKEGKMSTRKGNVIWLLDLINEGVRRAMEINRETAETVAIGAIKFNDLKRESTKEIVFDWDEVLNLKGDSGPYLQYTYVRACSVLENAKMHNIEKLKNWKLIRNCLPAEASAQVGKLPARQSLGAGGEIGNLERLLYRFPEVVIKSTSEYAPHHIATYLVDLAHSFNVYYGEKKIVDLEHKEVSGYRLALTEAVTIVLKNGLDLLGIKLPEKM